MVSANLMMSSGVICRTIHDQTSAISATKNGSHSSVALMKLVLNELSALKKLCRVIQEYNSDKTMDYASVQEAMDGICLTIGDIQQATTHFKKAMAIYEVLFESEPAVIEAKKQELLETYTQSGVYLGKKLLSK